MKRIQRYLLHPVVILFFCILPLLIGCSDSSSSNPIGSDPGDPGGSGGSDFQAALAWVWGYDADTETFTAYHSDGGVKRATFAAPIHSHMQIMYSTSDPQNTIWMGKDHRVIGFTTGFTPHGNHGHMETPEKFVSTSEVHNPVHIGISHDGKAVAFANDENGTFTMIDTETGTVTMVDHGSPHSSALITDGGQLVGVHMQENWARIIDPLTDTVLKEIEIGSTAHGDAYNSATDRAFIACDEGIEVIDTVSMAKTGRLDYPDAETVRTYILYHAGEIPVAVGPAYDTASLSNDDIPAETDRFFLVHMTDETIEAITIPGATLDWSKSNGLFDLSKDGRTAVFSDVNAALLYVVDVDPSSDTFRSVTTIPTPAAGVPVAVGAIGAHLFILSGTTVYPVDLNAAAVDMDGGFSVKDGTDWIYVTSFPGELIDESVDMGDEILNPEDVEDEDPGDEGDNGEPSGVIEVDEPRRLLVVASHDEPMLLLIDLADGSTESVELEAMAAQHGSSLSESGRFMLVGHSGEDGGVTVVDTGVWSEPHGNHFHHYTSAPSVVGHIVGPNPSHLVSHDGLNAFWFDGTGEFMVVAEESLEDGEMTVMATVATGQPHHGFAVPTHGAFFVTLPTDDMEGMPNVVGIMDLDGTVQAETDCPSTHGETSLANGAVAACSDGIAMMTKEAGTWASTKLSYPQVDEEDPWGYGAARPWGPLKTNADKSLLAAPMGASYVLIANPDEETTWAVDLGQWVPPGQFVSPVSTQWVDDGHVTALTGDGSLHLIDAEDGSVVTSLQIMEPFDERPDANPDYRWREVAVTGDHIYVTDPVMNQVIEILVGDDDLTVERIFDLDFTPGGFLEVANG